MQNKVSQPIWQHLEYFTDTTNEWKIRKKKCFYVDFNIKMQSLKSSEMYLASSSAAARSSCWLLTSDGLDLQSGCSSAVFSLDKAALFPFWVSISASACPAKLFPKGRHEDKNGHEGEIWSSLSQDSITLLTRLIQTIKLRFYVEI